MRVNMNEKEALIQREQQERVAIAAATTEVLSKLNVSIDKLPQKCKQILQQVCTAQVSSRVDQLDFETISLQQSREIAHEMDDEYEILKLRQKNEELQVKIDRNNRSLEELRKELAESRERLSRQSPNPEGIQDLCRQMRQKVASYEESYQKTKMKFNKLSVPEHIMPKEMAALAVSAGKLKEQATILRQRVDDIELERQARRTMLKTHSVA